MSKLTKGLKKTGIIAAKVVGTTVLTATGVVSAVTEKVISVTGIEPLQDIAHGAKSASFNGIRKMWGATPTEFERVDGAAEREKLQRQKDDALRQAEKKIEKYEQSHPDMSSEQRERINQARNKINSEKSYIRNNNVDLSSTNVKKVDEWDREWVSIGKLKDADLSPYNHCVGLYRHVVNGTTKYVGRAIELNNGGFRKRLSDYRRDSDSARKHTSGRIIHEHLDEIETYILVVGDTQEAIETTKKLEGEFVRKYNPEWNKQINI